MAATRSKPARRAAQHLATGRKRRPKPLAIPVLPPLIARVPETSDGYLARLKGLVSLPTTHVYFDTSFLMWLAKLGRPARAEFLAWVTAEGAKRFHVPLWAAHEFFKHQVRKTIQAEFKSELGLFDKATTRLYEKIRSFCSDSLFGFPSSSEMFLDEYRRTIQPLRAMLGMATRRGQDEVDFGLSEVATFIDRHLLPGLLSEVTDGIESEERIRTRGIIPPSFNDAHKRRSREPQSAETREEVGDNSFGDLVLWREILRHAAKAPAKTLIVATGDRKNDWFVNYHGVESVSPDFRKRVSAPRPVPLPHPLLVREAADRGAGDLVLLDPTYCGALMEKMGHQYKAFAAAALDTILPQIVVKNIQGQLWAVRLGQATKAAVSPELEQGAAGPEAAAASDPAADAAGQEIELETKMLTTERSACSPNAATFLTAFDSANVAVRADLYDQIGWDNLSDWTPNDLVVLGRDMARAAEAGDPSAIRFISDLRDQAASINTNIANPVYLGALGSIYFLDDLQRRPLDGSAFALVLLDVVALPALRLATTVLGAALAETAPIPLFVPGNDPAVIELEFVIQPSADNKSHADLLAINHDGRDLTTDVQTEESLRFTSLYGKAADERDFKVGELTDVVARFHLLPRQFVKPNLETTDVVRVAEFAGVDTET
jgi:hypothetical protein